MLKKLTPAKIKSHLAMLAFLVVAAAALTLTSVGVFNYVTLNAGVQTQSGTATPPTAPFGVASASPNVTLISGN